MAETIRNRYSFFLDTGFGPSTLASVVQQDYLLPTGTPNWQTLELGARLSAPTTQLDIGLKVGSLLTDTFVNSDEGADNRNELGISASPRHAGHPAFRGYFLLNYTDADDSLRGGRVTPGAGFRLTLPALAMTGGDSPVTLQPYLDTQLLLGWDADPVAYLRRLHEGDTLPHLARIGAGVRFSLGGPKLEDRWDQTRVAAVIADEALLLYPAIAGAFAMGALQSVFVDLPYAEFQLLKRKGFPVELDSFLFDIPRHKLWKERLETLEKADAETVAQTLELAGDVNVSLGAGVGGIFGAMTAYDSALILAARRGEISPAVPRITLLSKAGLGLAALGLAQLGNDPPGPFPRFGGHSEFEIAELLARPDPQRAMQVAKDFEKAGRDHIDRVERWAKDYRWRGAEYLGHGLLLSAVIGGAQELGGLDPENPLYALLSTSLGGAILGGQFAYAQYTDADYYTRTRFSGHMALAGSLILTHGIAAWLKTSGWNTF